MEDGSISGCIEIDDSKVRIVEGVIITGHATLAEVARYTKAAEPL